MSIVLSQSSKRGNGKGMIIEGYGEFPFEIGDILVDKEDGDICRLDGFNYLYVYLMYFTGELRGTFTQRIERAEDGLRKATEEELEVVALARQNRQELAKSILGLIQLSERQGQNGIDADIAKSIKAICEIEKG